MEIKQWVWWAQSLESMGPVAILYIESTKKTCIHLYYLEAIGHLVYKPRLRAHI